MQQYIEFVSNHPLHFAALAVVAVLLITSEITRSISGTKGISISAAIHSFNQDAAIFIDTRSNNDFANGHITGAINIPAQDLEKRIDDLNKYKDKQLIVYCQTGTQNNKPCKFLAKSGFSSVLSLKGGLNAWTNESYPLEKK